jgi:hypothetical protein
MAIDRSGDKRHQERPGGSGPRPQHETHACITRRLTRRPHAQSAREASAYKTLTPREAFYLRGGVLDKRYALESRAAATNRAFFDALLAHVRLTRAAGVVASAGQLDIVEFPGFEVL